MALIYCINVQERHKRPFVQSFFLAVQERGYYVLNDVFRSGLRLAVLVTVQACTTAMQQLSNLWYPWQSMCRWLGRSAFISNSRALPAIWTCRCPCVAKCLSPACTIWSLSSG